MDFDNALKMEGEAGFGRWRETLLREGKWQVQSCDLGSCDQFLEYNHKRIQREDVESHETDGRTKSCGPDW